MAARMLKINDGVLAENPVGFTVRCAGWQTATRIWIGTVREVLERDGRQFLSVQHFNGDWWSFYPRPFEVEVINPDESDYERGDKQ